MHTPSSQPRLTGVLDQLTRFLHVSNSPVSATSTVALAVASWLCTQGARGGDVSAIEHRVERGASAMASIVATAGFEAEAEARARAAVKIGPGFAIGIGFGIGFGIGMGISIGLKAVGVGGRQRKDPHLPQQN